MAKKKKEEKKIEEPKEKTIKKEEVVEVEKFPVSQLLENHKIKPIYAVGFLEHYGLTDDFKKEFEDSRIINMFSVEEFENMYDKYIKREI